MAAESFIDGTVHGHCDPAFAGVAEALAENFRNRGEVGAAVCVRVGGEVKVDLWGGMASARKGTPWERDTVCLVYSCTKAATALCAHMLVSRGELDLNAPVAEYWPEFAQQGKERTTVSMLLNHTAGLPALRTPTRADGCKDFQYMADQLAAAPPLFEPGTRSAYHMITFGWTVGEVVRRVSGMSLGTFFRTQVAEPLGLDFVIGMPESMHGRWAKSIPYRPTGQETMTDFLTALGDAGSVPHLSMFNAGGFLPNDPSVLAAEIGGAGGVSNARGLAGLFTPLCLDGSVDGVRLVDETTLGRMGEVSAATELDATLLVPTRFALGFMKTMDNRKRRRGGQDSVILGPRAFGHVGAGGSLGFADPECQLSFGYAMNQQGISILLNDRGQALVDATYRSLGYRDNASGAWRK